MEPHVKDIPKWNIIFLIYAELVDTAIQHPDAKPDQIKIQMDDLDEVILGFSEYDNTNVFTIKNTVEFLGETATSDITRVSKLIFDSKQKTSELKVIETLSIKDFDQKYQSIGNVFSKISQLYKAEKNILITFDHGSAFGIFKRVLPGTEGEDVETRIIDDKYVILDKSKIRNNKALYFIRNKPLKRNDAFYDESSILKEKNIFDYKTGFEILSSDHLAHSIAIGFPKGLVDALIMFNCDMQNIHTCYSLRKSVKYLVAPTGAIAWPGYDFKSIVDLIGQNPDLPMDGAMVTVEAINTLKPYYESLNCGDDLSGYAIFAISLKHYKEKVIPFLISFIAWMKGFIENPPDRKMVRDSRKDSYTVGRDFHYYLVDIRNFLLHISLSENPMIMRFSNYFEVLCKSSIIAEAVGNDIYPDDGTTWEELYNELPKGAGIYFPDHKVDIKDSVVKEFVLSNSPFQSSLFNAINWIEFINLLYA